MPILHSEDGVPPSKIRVVEVGVTSTDAVPSGTSKIEEFTPPAGYIWEISRMFLLALPPTGAASGTHQFSVYTGGGIGIGIHGKSVFGSKVSWNYSVWDVADSLKIPSSEEATLLALQSILCDQNTPLKVYYSNDTNVDQTIERTIVISVKETPII